MTERQADGLLVAWLAFLTSLFALVAFAPVPRPRKVRR